MEVETLVDGMVDLVGLASVNNPLALLKHYAEYSLKIGDKDKFRIAQESFQAQSRAESMVSRFLCCYFRYVIRFSGSRRKLVTLHHPFHETFTSPFGRSAARTSS